MVLAIILPVICIGGFWLPELGYVEVGLSIMLPGSAIFRKHNTCNRFCPRRSFLDQLLKHLALYRKMPLFLTSRRSRNIVLLTFGTMMATRLIMTEGRPNIVFVEMCSISTIMALFLGFQYSPRAWCNLCPVGTGRRMIINLLEKQTA